MYPHSCLLSVSNVKFWPGQENMCLCQKRPHFPKVTFETCSVSQSGAHRLCTTVSTNQKGQFLEATLALAEESAL